MDGGLDAHIARTTGSGAGTEVPLPDYLVGTYWWAYLTPASVFLFDNPIFLTFLLWGNLPRLIRATCAEVLPGQRVLQTANAYGNLSIELAKTVGETGALDVIDVAPLQVDLCRRKLAKHPHAKVEIADATTPIVRQYDTICCFFLLHEVPDREKKEIVDNILTTVPVGGRAVFVDYHRAKWWHPLRMPMSLVFRWLEPFAFGLIDREIAEFASKRRRFVWRKQTLFGGLYQKVVAERPLTSSHPLV
jgi:Methyltransferase domain